MQFHQADLSPMHARSLFLVFLTTVTLLGCGGSEGSVPLDFPVSTKTSSEPIQPDAVVAPVLSSNGPVTDMTASEEPIENSMTIAAKQEHSHPETQIPTAVRTTSAAVKSPTKLEPTSALAPADVALEMKADDLFATSPVRTRNGSLAGQLVEH